MILFPSEFTTMAGRRLRDAVKTVLTSGGNGEVNRNVHVVIAGLTNSYSQYVTTFEEYQVQRYEVCISISPTLLFGYYQCIFPSNYWFIFLLIYFPFSYTLTLSLMGEKIRLSLSKCIFIGAFNYFA